MTPGAIDIVIVSFNTREDVLACLRSIEADEARVPRHVFLVDNASTDGTTDAVRAADATVEIIALDRNIGFGAANNLAARRGSASLILFLNSDTVVPPGAIDALASRLLETGATAIGPRLVDADGRPEVSFGRMLTPAAEVAQMVRVRLASCDREFCRRRIERHLSTERAVDWVSGACLMVRRDAALAAGLFDERFFLYEEDVDFCAALRAQGGRVLFSPATSVMHRRGRSPRRAATAASAYDRSHLAFYDKHAPRWVPLLRLWLRLRGRTIR